MDWPSITAIAAIATAFATGAMAIPTVLRGLRHVAAWNSRNALYRRLQPHDLDILKAMSESNTTRISLNYDNSGDQPQIRVMADCILSKAVQCRMNVSESYQSSLTRLMGYGLLGVDLWPWRYAPYPAVATYKTTEAGQLFILKYTSGLHRAERLIRKRIKGLRRHRYKGSYSDEVGEAARDRLPNVLRAQARHERYDAASLGTHPLNTVRLYEYPPGARPDELECMAVIQGCIRGVSSNDLVFLLFDHDNQPRFMVRDQETSRLNGSYIVQSEVIGVEETEPAGETVLFLRRAHMSDSTSYTHLVSASGWRRLIAGGRTFFRRLGESRH